MKGNIEERTLAIARECVESKKTVRQLSKEFGLSKTTLHKDLTERLYYINLRLYYEVRKVLNDNKKERSERGGNATKMKYAALKNS